MIYNCDQFIQNHRADSAKGSPAVVYIKTTKLVWPMQDPSVASATSNAARGLQEFNPFEEQDNSQAKGESKVVHFES